MTVSIRRAENSDCSALAFLACRLWPHHSMEEMEEEFSPMLAASGCAVFVAWEDARPVGFAQCQLRHDYVEGTSSSPVGYLEGIYVAEDFRKQGIAKEMLAACEAWAREQGCREFASDCELDNEESLRFHKKLGFQEANRIICFTKPL